jgi:hypothetical protein
LSQDSQVGVLKFLKLGLLWLWRPITSSTNLQSKWGLKQSCSPHQDLFNDMWHATYTQIYQGDSWLLVVGNQICNLIISLFFCYNLCFKYPNESCKPILNICVPRAFQLYNELFNAMNFNPYNRCMKIRKSIRTLIPKMGLHLGMWGFIPSHSLAFPGIWNVIHGLHFWLASLQPLVLVASPKLRLRTQGYGWNN